MRARFRTGEADSGQQTISAPSDRSTVGRVTFATAFSAFRTARPRLTGSSGFARRTLICAGSRPGSGRSGGHVLRLPALVWAGRARDTAVHRVPAPVGSARRGGDDVV